MNIYLGNEAPHEVFPADAAPEDAKDVFRADADGKPLLVSRKADHVAGNPAHLTVPDDLGPLDALRDVVGVWDHLSTKPPSWVAAQDSSVAELLSKQFGCEVRDYDEVLQDVAALTGVEQ